MVWNNRKQPRIANTTDKETYIGLRFPIDSVGAQVFKQRKSGHVHSLGANFGKHRTISWFPKLRIILLLQGDLRALLDLEMAMNPLVIPVALASGAMLWVYRYQVVSFAASKMSGMNIRVQKIRVSSRRMPDAASAQAPSSLTKKDFLSIVPISVLDVEISDLCLSDPKGRESLLIPLLALSLTTFEGAKEAKEVSLKAKNIQATVYFDNYMLTESNWTLITRSSSQSLKQGLNTSSKKSKKEQVNKQNGTRAPRLSVVELENGLTLKLKTSVLPDPILMEDVHVGSLKFDIEDFSSIPKFSVWIEKLAIKELMVGYQQIPPSFQTALKKYTVNVLEEETKEERARAQSALDSIGAALDKLGGTLKKVVPKDHAPAIENLSTNARKGLRDVRTLLQPETWKKFIDSPHADERGQSNSMEQRKTGE